MSEERTIEWPGKSGTKYKYWIYSIESTFKSAPANYIFAEEKSKGEWAPIYIGQTKDLADRLSDHEREECAKKNGAKHIHIHRASKDEAERRKEERDLIDKWDTPCNRD